MFNCMLIDLQGMLTKDFKMTNAEIEPQKSISTVTAVTTQIILPKWPAIFMMVQRLIFIDEVLTPFVQASYKKHLKIAKEWQIADQFSYAERRTEKECYDAFQLLEYEVNTLHTANGQTPFVTF
ncbi:MAG: anaerobic ribonucleoside-triphosphate reductase [Candidatus Phlomobacter fragariae]